MWFAIAMMFIALLSALDIGIYSYIGYRTNVTPFQYGLISALWSVTFIISNIALGKLSDKGRNKLLILISFLSMGFTGILFSFHSLAFLAAAYMFHALGVASSNLALSATIFELKSSDKWKYYIELQRFSLYFIRGISLVSLYFIGPMISLDYIIFFSVAVGFVTFISLPSINLKIERSLQSFSNDVDSIINRVKMFSYFAYDKVGYLPDAIKSGIITTKKISTRSISLSLFFATFTGDYVFTILPLLTKSNISLRLLWLSFGITGLIMGISLIIISSYSTNSKRIGVASILFRGIWLVFALSLIRDIYSLVLYIAISYMLFALIDITLYNIFSEGSSGYGSHFYYMSRELGTLTGSLLVGIVYGLGYQVFVIVPIISTILSVVFLIIS